MAEFFRLPHSRAALLCGGIVWRIAIEFLPLEAAYNGPSDSATNLNNIIPPSGSPGEQPLVDDILTSEEMDFICGVYTICDSDGHGKPAQSSWWPKQSTWLVSPYNLGYWTPSCEHWFQSRLSEIRKVEDDNIGQKGQPLPASCWRSVLAGSNRDSKKLSNEMDCAAQFFFEGRYAP
jgi:hypothetical protein